MSLALKVVVLTCIISVIQVAGGISIAPGEEEGFCQTLQSIGVAPAPGYAPNVRVLMDTWNYQNLLPPHMGAVWDQVDTDTRNNASITTNWIQQSNTVCQQSVQVCGFAAGPQSNWLLTQLINRTVDGLPLSQVSVQIEFELQNCDVLLNCQRTFNTYVYETLLASDAARRNLRNYRQVQRVSTDITTGAKVNETIVVTFQTDESFFYFAVEDETTCVVITRMIVFYNVCPNQTIELVSAPEIIAPATGFTEEEGSCASNAEAEDGNATRLTCSPDGTWTVLGSGCRCAPGSGFENGSCSLCPIGTYSSPANRNCSTCPESSVSTTAGLHQCICNPGYYRAETGEEDLPCSLPPPPPTNIRLMVISDNSIFVIWDPPAENLSNRPLTYSVYTALDGGERVPVGENINATNHTIMNLLPGRMYTVFVSTSTSFTSQLPDNVFSTFSASAEATTTGSSGGSGSTVAIAVAVMVVVLFVIGAVICVIIICVWFLRKNGSKNSQNQIVDGHQSRFESEEVASQYLMKGFSVQSSFKHNLPLNLVIPSTRIKFDNTVGQGEFGVVYKAYLTSKDQVTTDIVAIKTLKGFYNREAVTNLLKECSRMCSFNHPNILSLSGVCLDGGPAPYIIMPLMTNGSLLNHLKKNRDSLVISVTSSSGSESDSIDARIVCKQLMDMCLQIARGMEYLAKMKMVHRDLAARNCMIDMHYVIKVADFGLAESVEAKEYFRQDKSDVIRLPMKWMAPESFQDYIFTEKTDVWAYGVTCWEIFTGGKVPYPSINIIDLPGLLVDGERLQKPMNDACSDQMYTLMLQCWQFEAKNRPAFSHLVSSLSQSLEAMADYMEINGTTIPNSNPKKN